MMNVYDDGAVKFTAEDNAPSRADEDRAAQARERRLVLDPHNAEEPLSWAPALPTLATAVANVVEAQRALNLWMPRSPVAAEVDYSWVETRQKLEEALDVLDAVLEQE